VNAIAVQSDGSVIIAGSMNATGINRFMLRRVLSSGHPDPAFGDRGQVNTHIGSSHSAARAVAVQPDGKIVAVGSASGVSVDGDYSGYGVARYNGDGSLDTSFNETGSEVVFLAQSQQQVAYAVAIAPDGKIVIAGNYGAPGYDGLGLIRLTDSGILDTSFNSSGMVTDTDVGFAVSLTVQNDGKILVLGHSSNGQAQYIRR
jgi:uncharacterized delta-60 repeat protein